MLSHYNAIGLGLIILLFGASVRTATNELESIENFTRMGEKYYHRKAKLEHTWFEALHLCRAMDASLASFDTRNEFIAVRDFPRYDEHQFDYWIAYNNWGETDKYYSATNGRRAPYTHWHENATYKEDKKQCVAIRAHGHTFAMLTYDCMTKLGYLCEIPKPLTINFIVA